MSWLIMWWPWTALPNALPWEEIFARVKRTRATLRLEVIQMSWWCQHYLHQRSDWSVSVWEKWHSWVILVGPVSEKRQSVLGWTLELCRSVVLSLYASTWWHHHDGAICFYATRSWRYWQTDDDCGVLFTGLLYHVLDFKVKLLVYKVCFTACWFCFSVFSSGCMLWIRLVL